MERAEPGREECMSKRGTTGELGLGWVDVVAILFVVAVLAYSFGEIATGRLQELAKEANRVAAAVTETVEAERAGDEG
jgi:hypothetical protein